MANQQPQRPVQRSDEAFAARRSAVSAILMLLLVLLILLLIAAATERTDVLKFASLILAPSSALALQPKLTGMVLVDDGRTKFQPAAIFPATVDARFREYYDSCGGVMVFGLPISPALEANGQVVQWFERARLEQAAGVVSGVQRGRIGAEYLATMPFPRQIAFRDRADARYFSQTGHGVTAPFLAVWNQVGGVEALGYPLSEQLQEVQANGRILTVQYFERGRLEVHPEHNGTAHAVQIGLLGRALYLGEAKLSIIAPVQPTPVP